MIVTDGVGSRQLTEFLRVRDLKMKKWGVLFFVPRCLAYIIR